MNLPSYEEGIALFRKYTVPTNIQEHCEKVCEIATFLAEKLKAKGVPINVELTRIGALFHDWMKAVTLEDFNSLIRFGHTPTPEEIKAWEKLRERFKDKRECEIASELLKDTYPELAHLLFNLGNSTWYNKPLDERRWEIKVIHYADWRVLGTTVIPLQQRVDDLFKRYNHKIMKKGVDKWNKAVKTEFQHEKEICEVTGIKPEGIK